jgi:hypothetical protein
MNYDTRLTTPRCARILTCAPFYLARPSQEVHLDTVEIDPDLDQDTHLADIPN